MARNDLTIYDRHADGWWRSDDRTFRSLRAISEFRLAWLERHLPFSLAGAMVADIGCGGGLLALPLAARGARVVGLDHSLPSLRAAQRQAPGAAHLVCADLRRCPLRDTSADLVLLADVLEHVADWPAALHEAARLLRPGGALYVNTINRTRRARLLAVHLAEGLGLVPRGTHDAALFVRPEELCRAAAHDGLRCRQLDGEAPRLLATLRTGAIHLRQSRCLALAYTALFLKEPA
ncbi:MAG: bifunctional 2-polyprenyl-6-hydroxyphenol methylase/3-demethylubiquinol 3-O-methyltransferase UbiG [Planctomycetota bacterium]